MIAWFGAFVMTCLVEITIVRALVRVRRGRTATVLAAQLATHPIVWIAMATLPGAQLPRLAAVELWAMLVEAAIYARWLRLPRREALAVSAAANAGSLLLAAAIASLL